MRARRRCLTGLSSITVLDMDRPFGRVDPAGLSRFACGVRYESLGAGGDVID